MRHPYDNTNRRGFPNDFRQFADHLREHATEHFGQHFGDHADEHHGRHFGEHGGERGRRHGGPDAGGGVPPFPPGPGRGFPGPGFGPSFGPGFTGFGPGDLRGERHGGPGRREHDRGHRGHGRGGRTKRGNVRVAILTLLAEKPMHGYEMIKEITERSNGTWRPSPGSVYPTLQLLADEGLVTNTESDSGKRLYALTDDGRAAAEKLDGTTPWDEAANGADPSDLDLRSAVGQLHTAAWQVSQAGTSDQKSRAVKALVEARSALYLILAEAGVPSESDTDESDDTAAE
jgi:DNA-binding PadR family transcriptional regulator